jgi:hypothetical protein
MRLIIFQLAAIAIMIFLLGCSSKEKVLKVLSQVAKVNPGDFELKKFEINGASIGQEPMWLNPGDSLEVEVLFLRTKDSREIGTYLASIVLEKRETELAAKRSHLVLNQIRVKPQKSNGIQRIVFSIESPTKEQAEFAEKFSLGRYFHLVVSEDSSEIAACRFNLSK